MATRILSVGNVHIQFNDTAYTGHDTVNNTTEGFFNIKTTGGALVARVYNDGIIYWHTPPAAIAWEAIGAQLKITLP